MRFKILASVLSVMFADQLLATDAVGTYLVPVSHRVKF